MAGDYIYTSWEYQHRKYGKADTSTANWTQVYYNMAITVKVWPDGTVGYSITSTNNAKQHYSYDRCSLSLWIEINGETVVPATYFTSSNSTSGFPRDLNSTKTGTLTSRATGDSIIIRSKILPASDYTQHSDWWNASLSENTLNRDIAPPSWTSAGGAVVNSITDNGDNTLTIVTTMGANGDNNSVSNVHIYGLVNSTEEVTTTNSHFAFGNGVINGRQVTFVIPAPSYEDEYYVRVRAYSISQLGDNPGGTTVTSGPCHYYHNVVKVKINNIWRNGIVWVKVDGIWKKASKVYAKVGNTWKLSDTV